MYSCNYIVSKSDDKAKNSKNGRARIDTDKEQAKLLVNTSQTVVEVIDICETVENFNIEEKKKTLISELKKNQIEILNEIKLASSSVMISVPYNTRKSLLNISEDTLLYKEKLNVLDIKVNQEKKLINALKEKTSNEIIVEMADTIMPIIDNNLTAINELNRH